MAKQWFKLAQAQWGKIESLLPIPKNPDAAADHRPTIERSLSEYSGFFSQARLGLICPNNTPVLLPVGVGLNCGNSKMSGSMHGGHFLLNLMLKARLTGLKHLPMRVLPTPQKRGQRIGSTKRGKGTKWMGVDDGQCIALEINLVSVSPSEIKLLEKTLWASQGTSYPPGKDKMYDR